ncbi:hypothetical protein QQ045_003913 [Rhodiola kirilowii]
MHPFHLTCVYASTDKGTRKEIWEKMTLQSASVDRPWFVCGDFNVILSPQEKKGRNLADAGAMAEFANCMVSASLDDAGFKGPPLPGATTNTAFLGSGSAWTKPLSMGIV